MKTNVIKLSIVAAIFAGVLSMSFRPTAPKATQYMQVNVLESVIPGGTGRSRIIITDASGNTVETINIKNYYSLTGVNFKNIGRNDKALMILLNQYAQKGWKVHTASASTAQGRNQGIFVTKYLLSKD